MKAILIKSSTAVLCLAAMAAHAGDASDYSGAYAGIGAGVTGIDIYPGDAERTDSNRKGAALKLFAGYQLNRYFGVEGGYLRTGHFSQTLVQGTSEVQQTVKTHAWYAAGTARLPIGESFALTGQAGVAFSKASGDDTITGADSIRGSHHSLLVGLGAQYRISERTDLQLDLTAIDRLARRVELGAVTVSVRRRF